MKYTLPKPFNRFNTGSSVSYDSDAQAYFDAVDLVGGSLSVYFKNYYNELIEGLKLDGVYSSFLGLYPNAGGTILSAEINQINPTSGGLSFYFGATPPTIDPLIGVTFNGVDQYASTGIYPDIDFIDPFNHQEGVYCLSRSTGSNMNIIGSQDTSLILVKSRHTASKVFYYADKITSSTTSAADSQFIQTSRSSDQYMSLAINGTVEGTNTAITSLPVPAVEFYYGAKNKNDVAEQFANGQFCFLYFAQGLNTLQELEINNRITTFLTEIGAI
jgi:hypothetical protein